MEALQDQEHRQQLIAVSDKREKGRKPLFLCPINTSMDKRFSFSNIFQSPATSLLGISALMTAVGNAFIHGLPTDASGWVAVSAQLLISIGALLGK